MIRNLAGTFIFTFLSNLAFTQSWVNRIAGFPLHHVRAIITDQNDHALIQKSAELLSRDLLSVFGKEIPILHVIDPAYQNLIIIGSKDKSAIIHDLINNKTIDEHKINTWESYAVQYSNGALVIAGADRRGTAFGVFELSKQIGVSPWYFWADAPIKKLTSLYVNNNLDVSDAPNVKYRGIFLNDEAPALSGWAKEKFGGFNHLFYEKVFELILRLKGNYIWPAMWGNAFYDDDSLNIQSADQFGIVIGTSHHEPLMRAHDEWRRYGNKQKWDYDSTESGLKDFWRKGMVRATNEKIVSIGMRGDGDRPMSRETATNLLERIVKDQRQIIEEVTSKPARETPQLWALYKEVQDYYDKGMRVPEDVTLLLCDDNWGNIRKLPKYGDAARKGGYGIYYHFDYVGGPRNYKWVNTNPLPRIWEQMHLAYEYNVRNIWIVNVGDLKPMELPISFFLDYAWKPEAIHQDQLQSYTEEWYENIFGNAYSKNMAEITSQYLKLNGRRKPELLDANTYSLDHYNEAERVTQEYSNLYKRADRIHGLIPPEYRDAYYQLVLHPVKACSNLQEMYTAVAKNKWYASRYNAEAQVWADKAKDLYSQDSLISLEYHQLKNGKWNHMMDQTHIGYTYWQQPSRQRLIGLRTVSVDSIKKDKLATPWNQQLNLNTPEPKKPKYYSAIDKVISLKANSYHKAINAPTATWTLLPDHGREDDAMTTFPVTSPDIPLTVTSPHLEYAIELEDTGTFKLHLYHSPTLNFHNDGGLLYAISIDKETPQTISLNKDDNQNRVWESWVANNIIDQSVSVSFKKKGKHTIKYWMITPGVVLQKLVLDLGGMEPSYLGPPAQ